MLNAPGEKTTPITRRVQPAIPPNVPPEEHSQYKLWAAAVDRDIIDMRYDLKTIRNAVDELRHTVRRALETIGSMQPFPAADS